MTLDMSLDPFSGLAAVCLLKKVSFTHCYCISHLTFLVSLPVNDETVFRISYLSFVPDARKEVVEPNTDGE